MSLFNKIFELLLSPLIKKIFDPFFDRYFDIKKDKEYFHDQVERMIVEARTSNYMKPPRNLEHCNYIILKLKKYGYEYAILVDWYLATWNALVYLNAQKIDIGDTINYLYEIENLIIENNKYKSTHDKKITL